MPKAQAVRGAMASRRRILFALGALGAAIGVVLVLLEVGLRLYFGAEYFYPHYPNSVRQFYPSEEITPGVTGVSTFSTNSYGTRGREPSGDERLRVLTIGGSTTADTILDDSEAWPARLESYLDAELGKQDAVWVANSGVDGLHSEHHLMHAIYLLPRLPQMDYVIVYAGLNDMGTWLHSSDFDPDDLDDPENWADRIGESFRWSQYTAPDQPFFKRTALWKTLSRIKDRFLTAQVAKSDQAREIVQDAELRWLEQERRRRAEIKRELVPKAQMETLPAALAAYGATLSRTAAEIRKNGAEPIFVTQVVQASFRNDEERNRLWMGELEGGAAYVSEDQIPEMMARFNQQMMEIAERENALALDLPQRMDPDGRIFYDGVHFNEKGADAGAAEIAAFFREKNLLDPVL